MIKKYLKRAKKYLQLYTDRSYYNVSYAQEGEDLILNRIFEDIANGFYVDIGAHHPKRFSNTYFFYKKGWRGINIDAMPGSMQAFKEVREYDINLEKAVASVETELIYYVFDEPALNGFSEVLSESRDVNTRFNIIDKIKIKTQSLKSILETHLPKHVKVIDFMSIDVEGLDLDVLKSNDWQKFRPKIILIELLNFESFNIDPVFSFLNDIGYKFQAKSFYTFFFADSNAN